MLRRLKNMGGREEPTALDYDKLLTLSSDLGYHLLLSGAEIYRVEESVQYLLTAYGVETGEVFVIPNCVIVSLTAPGQKPITRVRRVPGHGTDISRKRQRRSCRDSRRPVRGGTDRADRIIKDF